ncbi:ATP-binding protein [Candidatus Saccharibacteria bacterium]|nr:ATP-binding protein [Candidatus Saccharibacteria bacterium]
MKPITITNKSILSILEQYKKKHELVIVEYVWNAFDAGANRVDINYGFPQKINGLVTGYPSLEIADDGDGWDMSDSKNIESFLDSSKKKISYKSTPHGSRGIGRFSFYAIANTVKWITVFQGKCYSLKLQKASISQYELSEISNDEAKQNKGTKAIFDIDNEKLTETFFEDSLPKELLKHFAWFLCLYPNKNIYINGTALKLDGIVEREKEEESLLGDKKMRVKLIQWKEPLADKENSKIYFIGSDGEEVFKLPSGLNNKSDVFAHSAYATSEIFDNYIPSEMEVEGQASLLDTDQKRLVTQAKNEIRKLLENFRKPYIEKISNNIIDKLKEERVMPTADAVLVPEEDFNELVRQTYVIAPELFTNVSATNKKMTLQLLASLMGTNERNLILKTVDEIYKLTEDQKRKLEDLLNRTSLGNVVDTISEIDHRLQTLDDLETLIYDPEKYRDTKEVKHLQKILDNEFWVFGEEYRMVSSTEGKIKKVIEKYAQELLSSGDYKTEADSKREMELFLSKQKRTPQSNGISKIHNIIVELKRPEIKLGRKEVDQIKDYKEAILKDSVCKGENMEWTFILIGKDYSQDGEISSYIESAKNHGESSRGLIMLESSRERQYKIYVRRWPEVIQNELRPQYEYLKQKLQMKLKYNSENETPDETTTRHLPEFLDQS